MAVTRETRRFLELAYTDGAHPHPYSDGVSVGTDERLLSVGAEVRFLASEPDSVSDWEIFRRVNPDTLCKSIAYDAEHTVSGEYAVERSRFQTCEKASDSSTPRLCFCGVNG